MQVRPNSQAELITPEHGPALPLRRDGLRDRQRRRRPDSPADRARVSDRVQGADPVGRRDGQLTASDALAPGTSQPVVAGRQAPRHQRRPHRGGRVRRAEGARRARAARLRPDLQGQPHHDDDATTGGPTSPGNAGDGKRFTLQEIYLSPLAHTLYDDGRDPTGAPSFFGLQKKAGALHLQQPHRAARDGRGHARRGVPGAAAVRQPRAPERRPALRRARSPTSCRSSRCGCARPPTRRSGASWSAAGWAGS